MLKMEIERNTNLFYSLNSKKNVHFLSNTTDLKM